MASELTQDQLALIYLALHLYLNITTQWTHSTTINEVILIHEIDNISAKLKLPPVGSMTWMRPSWFDHSFAPAEDFDTRDWLEPETEKYMKVWKGEQNESS